MTFDPTSIVLTEAATPYRWKLTAPLTWTGRFRGADGSLGVTASSDRPFETDLASVPRWLTWVLPRYGKYTKAAVLHDFLCQNFRTARAVAPSPSSPPDSTPAVIQLALNDRSDADEIFREAMRELGVPWARRWVMWSAVNWATMATSLWPGRRSTPFLRWTGWAVLVLGLAATVVLVAAGAVGDVLGDSPDWKWLRATGLAIAAFSAAAACALVAGYVAQGRWDRWLVDLAALALTIASLPLLAGGAAVAVLLVFYLIFEDAFSGFSSFRARLGRRRPPIGPRTPRHKRLAEVQAS